MNSIHLSILGSKLFSNILNELELENLLNPIGQENLNINKNISVKVLFAENLKIREVKNFLLESDPVVLLLEDKSYIKNNNLSLSDFQISLELPIEILSFKEILNILVTKYNFLKKSRVIIKGYEIDSNERSIKKK